MALYKLYNQKSYSFKCVLELFSTGYFSVDLVLIIDELFIQI